MKKKSIFIYSAFVLFGLNLFAPNVVKATVGVWSTNAANMYYNDGNIGLGTQLPKGKLSIYDTTTNINGNGGANFTSRIAPLSVGDSTGTGKALLIDSNQIEQADNSDLYINNNSTATLVLNKGGGNVGVGTHTPDAKLTVYTAPSSSQVQGVSLDAGSFTTFANAQSSYYLRARDIGAGKTPFIINGNGRVGINNSNPQETLTVNGSVCLGACN